MPYSSPLFLATALRRRALAERLRGAPVLLAAGSAPARNYPQNPYAFRASSHVLYLLGEAPPGSFLWLDGHRTCLMIERPDALDALWHGDGESADAMAERLDIDVLPLDRFAALRGGRPVATLRPARVDDARALASLLARSAADLGERDDDLLLTEALIAGRLAHDTAAIAELRRAADATVLAHQRAMERARVGMHEFQVAAGMEHVFAQYGFGCAYPSIVTVRGEVLHQRGQRGTLRGGDLLLADVGAETDTGYAADVTRTWPVSGRFSNSQRAIYDAVLAAQAAAIAEVRPGVRYREVHFAAARALTERLVDIGLLIGRVDELVEGGAHALFMPHGVGHLLGLDVHDMEDLGDRAGYAPSRKRSTQFGLGYLRLDRDLTPGMAVTIEPGFYQVPMLLADPARFGIDPDVLNRERLADFADVRGIRIEDDVLVTETGHEVLTWALPKDADAVERLRERHSD